MKTLIIGGGVVGAKIADRLVREGHDVTIVDPDSIALERISSHLDVRVVSGSGALPRVLHDANMKNTDMVVAVTNSDEINIVACMNAGMLRSSETIRIARVRDPSFSDTTLLDENPYGLDLMINPEHATAERILALLHYPDVTEISEFAEGLVRLIGLRVSALSPLSGVRLIEMTQRFPDAQFNVAALVRSGDVLIPRGDSVILPGDEIYLVTAAEDVESTLTVVGISTNPLRRILILGGSLIGEFVAKGLEKNGITPKLIESDLDRAMALADLLETTTVIHGSPTDTTLLLEENAGEMHAIIICDEREETNLMAALLTRQMGNSRIISTTSEFAYGSVIKTIGIDVCLSPRMLAVSAILRFIRDGRVIAVQAIGDDDAAEVLEFEAHLSSEAVGKPIQEIRLPRGATIAALVRNETVLIPRGPTVIDEGDHVVVFVQTNAIHAVEKLLRQREDEA